MIFFQKLLTMTKTPPALSTTCVGTKAHTWLRKCAGLFFICRTDNAAYLSLNGNTRSLMGSCEEGQTWLTPGAVSILRRIRVHLLSSSPVSVPGA